MLTELRLQPDVMRPLFVHEPKPLTASEVDAVFEVPNWSSPGSNQFRQEKKAVAYFKDFLEELEGKLLLKEFSV